jgi:hypothetical protein
MPQLEGCAAVACDLCMLHMSTADAMSCECSSYLRGWAAVVMAMVCKAAVHQCALALSAGFLLTVLLGACLTYKSRGVRSIYNNCQL